MALKLTQNSTGKTWSSGSKKEEKKEERQKTTGASAPVEEKYSSPSGKLTLTRTSTSTSTPADDPNLLERIGKTLSGTGRRQVSGYAGAAENLMENIRRLDSLNSAEHRKAQQEQENAAHYREMLARGTMDDGTVIDAAQRARLEKLLTSAENRAKVYQQSNEAIHQPISGLIEKTDAYGDRVGAASEADLQRAKQGAGVVGRTLVDAGSALTDVLADAAANVVLPGLGTAGRVARSYGHGAEAAEDKGFDLAQQNLYGGGSAALGELANRMFSSNPILQKAFGNGALDDILLPGLEKSLPGSIVKSAFGEALEEGSENIGDYFLQRAIMGDQADEFSWKDVGYDALIGGLVGGVTGVSRGRGSQNLQNQETDSHGSQNRAADAAPAKSSTPAEGNSMGKTENVSEGLKTASADTEAKQQPLPSPADRRASVMETAKQTLGKEGYRMFEAAYRDSDDPATSYSELTRAYNDGLVNRKTGSRVLSEGQYESMFEAGRVDAAANVAAQSKLAAKETTFSRKDSGIDYSDAVTSEYVKGVDRKTVKVIDTVAKTLGLKVRFADSVDGGSANAQIQSGIVTIEKNNPNPLRSIFGHEITHRMQDLAPAEYARLREAVAQSGWTNAAIQMTQDKYAEHGRSISNEAALDEAVADYVGALMEDSGEMERFIRKYQNDRTMLEKLRDLVRDLARKLKGSGYDANLRNAEKQLSKALDAAAAQVKTNVNADVDVNVNANVSVDADTKSAAPRDSLKTWSASEYTKEREKAIAALQKELGVSKEKAAAYIDSINSVARAIADDRVRLDYDSNLDEGATVLKPNSEYKYTVDMSTLCAKRLLFTGTFDAIQKALPNTALDSEDIVKLRKMMQDRDLQVACGICYVEPTRREIGRITQEFIERYKAAQKSGGPISRINSEGKEVVLKVQGKTFAADPNYTPNLAELNTTDIDLVKRDHREVYDAYLAFMNARGQAKPKLLETRAEYKGEILKHFKSKAAVKSRNAHGGLRLQSYSDFEVPHMIDMMQVIMDMSRVGLKSQAYTKVPAFAAVFGDTGVKINLSLIAKGDGLDADGNLIFDDVEGMDHKEAFKLRDQYSKNVGTILVGKNDAHIIAAMADPRIDFIIPFHKSSWKESLYEALGLTGYDNYELYQNEKPIDPNRKISNYDPSEYWDDSKTGDENAQIYLEKCREDGRIPKFPQFQSYPGYWKLLIDFKMYDNDGVRSPQTVVRPEFNEAEAQKILKEYEGGHRSFPVAQDVVDEFVDNYKAENPKTRYSLKDAKFAEAEKRFGTTTDFEEAGFILPNGKMLRLTDDDHRGERAHDHRAIGLIYGVDVDLGVNHGFNEESNKFLDEFVENGGIRFDAGVPDLGMDVGLQLSGTTPLTREQEQIIRDLVEWKRDREVKFESHATEEDMFLYDGPLAIRIDFGADSGYAVGSSSAKDLAAWGKKALEYEGGNINADRIISDIRHFYKTGEIRQASSVAQFHKTRFSLKDSDSLAAEIARIQKEGRAQKRSKADVQADIRKAVEEAYAGMVEEYGAIDPGERAARDVQVPKKTGKGKKVSQTVRTAMEAAATPDEALPDIQKLIATGDFSYDVYTDKQAIADASSTIESVGWAQALADWTKQVKNGEVSKKNTAMGWALYNNAVNSGDTKTALTVLDYMIQHQRNAAQALQATRILKKLSPETQLYQIQRSVENLQEELNKRYGDQKAPKIVIPQELADRYRKAQTQEERDEVMKDIYRDVGRQMPSRFIDKWNAWRYLAMLGNPRTHVRNVVGNAGFAPIVATKNATATFIEWAVNGVSHGKLNRSKSMVGFSKADRSLLKAAWADFAKVEDIIMGSGKYSDAANPNQYIEEGRQIFKFKPLEAARKGNTSAMNVEDKWFSRPHYAAALASYCKQHGLSPEQIQRGKETKNARTYAIREAQKATYRDTNALSQTISELGRPRADETNPVKKGVGVVMEGILPFRKTPANILARGLEYSPMGLLNGIKQAVWDVKRGNKTGAEAIDSIASGLTGTGLLALGMYLAAQGLIRGHGSDDEDENEFKELMGHQAYALEIGNESYTLDWLAPEALPFFVGVNLWEQTEGSDEELTLSAMLNAVKTVTEPLLEMSCLQSLNDVFDSVGYATSDGLDGLPAALASAATSYLTQGLPTILGQAERTGEAVRMTTYTEKNAFLTGDMQYTLGKASARIPGVWDYQQIPYIDAWGREESTGATSERAVNNFLNPAYTSEIQTSAMEKELMRLYEKTGESKILPSRAAKYFNVGNQRKDLAADEYVKYAKKKGQNSHSLLTGLTANSTYKSLDSSDQVDAISKCYEYANSVAKAAVSDYEPDGWVAKAISASSTTGIKAEQYVTLYIQQGKIESYKNKVTGDTIDNSKGLLIMQMVYNTPGLTEKQRQQLFLDFGVGKTVRGYNKALVEQKLKIMKAQAK